MRAAGALLAVVLAGAAAHPAPASGQRAEAPPETVADEFLRGLESMAWAGLAGRIHPNALGRLQDVVTMLVRTDATGEVPGRLLGGVDPAGYAALDAGEVFRRVMASLVGETPGLLHALVTRRHEVVGSVPEGDSAHVVYRVLPRLQGAEPVVKVMTLARAGGPGGPWRVLRADELDVVRSALRGIPVGIRVPPPAADTGGVATPPSSSPASTG